MKSSPIICLDSSMSLCLARSKSTNGILSTAYSNLSLHLCVLDSRRVTLVERQTIYHWFIQLDFLRPCLLTTKTIWEMDMKHFTSQQCNTPTTFTQDTLLAHSLNSIIPMWRTTSFKCTIPVKLANS